MAIALLTALQRSGTGALGSAIRQHPDVAYLGEIFMHGEQDNRFNYNHFLLELVRDEPERALPFHAGNNFLDYLEYVERNHPKRVKVIDVKYNSLNCLEPFNHETSVLSLCRASGMPIIHLTRRNLLRTIVSLETALQTGEWHVKKKRAVSRVRITLDPEETLRHIQRLERQVRFIGHELSGYGPLAQFDYSGLFSPEGRISTPIARKLGDLLGVDGLDTVKPRLSKQGGNDLADSVRNYRELRAALVDTPYAWMLNGPARAG